MTEKSGDPDDESEDVDESVHSGEDSGLSDSSKNGVAFDLADTIAANQVIESVDFPKAVEMQRMKADLVQRTLKNFPDPSTLISMRHSIQSFSNFPKIFEMRQELKRSLPDPSKISAMQQSVQTTSDFAEIHRMRTEMAQQALDGFPDPSAFAAMQQSMQDVSNLFDTAELQRALQLSFPDFSTLALAQKRLQPNLPPPRSLAASQAIVQNSRATGSVFPERQTTSIPHDTVPREALTQFERGETELSSEIERYLIRVRAQISYERTYEALEFFGEHIDRSVLVFIAAQILNTAPLIVGGPPGIVLSATGSALAIAHYLSNRDDPDE